jgi:DNA-binding transcriptional LysR family regulator
MHPVRVSLGKHRSSNKRILLIDYISNRDRLSGMKHLDISLLQSFAAVVDSGSFTLASRYLCRTQSAVSMQIQKLEEMVGHRLLERESRKVRLTEQGQLLLDYARRMLRLNDDALMAMDQPFAEGHVRLGLPDDYAEFFLPEVLGRFALAYPRIQLEVIGALSGALQDMVEAAALDVALITRQPNRPTGRILRRERLVWVGSRQNPVRLSDSPLPLTLFPEGCVFRSHAIAALEAKGIPWRLAYTSQSFAGGKLAVSGGLAVTVMARSMVPPEWRVLGTDEGLPRLPEFEICMHSAAGHLPRAVKLLEEQLTEVVQTKG